ncbi:hypothetical protein [Cellulosimicrobium cellulans]|uniref:hypothetical protein n=1 Tax=Cellulosimicrobium cellulans TaxID=1710 RepID=UPI0028AC014D|nr:hypothetical protein [Cellulosimicrobium cellulans]
MIDIPGLPVPDAGPLFDAALLVHVAAGITSVVAGLVAMLSRKGSTWHVRAGRTFLGGLVALFVTMSVMAVTRWPATVHLVVLGAVALTAGVAGWRNRRRHGSDAAHLVLMSVAYVAMLTAFYVDNGPHLPLWERLPDWSFWFLPTLVGLPLVVAAVRRRRPARDAHPGRRASTPP